MIRYLILIVALCQPVAAAEPKAEPEKDAATKELDKLQGKWRLVADDLDGKATKTSAGYIMRIEKDVMLSFTDDGKELSDKSSLRIDPTKSPKTVDMTVIFCHLFPDTKETTIQGIYQLEKDELKIAMPFLPYRARPNAFSTKMGDHFTVVTYRRMKE